MFAFSIASHTAFSEYSLNGSMFIFNVPENITGSYLIVIVKKRVLLLLRYFIYTWGIIVNFFLKSLTPIECISILSIIIVPLKCLSILNNASAKLLLPAPN
jgi:hypothetical protein